MRSGGQSISSTPEGRMPREGAWRCVLCDAHGVSTSVVRSWHQHWIEAHADEEAAK